MMAVRAIAKLMVLEAFRKKDFYVTFVLTSIILLFATRMRFYDMSNAYRYLLDIGLFLGVLFASILTVSLAARQIPGEIQNKTAHVLLSKPVSRGQLIAGKFTGACIAGMLILFLFFAVLLLCAFSRTQEWSWLVAGQTYYLFCLALMLLTAMALFFSTFMSVTANASISLTLFVVISLYGVHMRGSAELLASPLKEIVTALYYAIPHFGFFDMRQRFIHGWQGAPATLLLFLTAYAVFYSFVFLFAALLVFRRKNIS